MLERLNPDPKRSDVLLEGREVVLEDFPAAALVSQGRLDATQRLRDQQVLLMQPLDPAVQRVEVAEDLAESVVHLLLERADPLVELEDMAGELMDLAIHPVESLIDVGEPLIDAIES